MGVCDLCNADLPQGEATNYTADEFRRLAAAGLAPGEEAYQAAAGKGLTREEATQFWWKSTVEPDTSNWALCPDCARRALPYQEVVRQTNERQGKETEKKDYDAGQVISSVRLVIGPVACVVSIVAWVQGDYVQAVFITAAAVGINYWGWTRKLPK